MGIPLRQLLRRGIELRSELPELSPLDRERLPDYAAWWHHRERIASLAAIVQDIRRDGILAKHPLRRLSPRLAQVDRPLELITGVLQAAEKHFAAVEASLGHCGVPREQWQTLAAARLLVDYAQQVQPVARIGRMDLLDTASQSARQFADAEQRFRRQQEVLAEARGDRGLAARNSRRRRCRVAIEQAKAFEQSLFAWLRLAWWRLRRILNDSYDFRSHVVRPRWSQVLGALQKEYEELDKLDGQRKAIAEQFRLDGDIDGLIAHIQQLRPVDPRPGPVARPDSCRVGEGRQSPADRRQDGRGRRAAPLAGCRIGQDHAPARGQSAGSTSSRVEAGAGGLG